MAHKQGNILLQAVDSKQSNRVWVKLQGSFPMVQHLLSRSWLLAIVLLLGGCQWLCAQGQVQKKIIEFGWDYPSIPFLKANLPEMEMRPFDGVVFSFQQEIMATFQSTPIPDSYFAFQDLAALPFSKFTNNFFFIRLQSNTGAHWYNDAIWKVIEENTIKLSYATKVGKVKGSLLDAEYYGENPLDNPWTYSAAQYPGKSFAEVQQQVRSRGSQFMQALQKHQPNQELLCLWIAGLVLADKTNMPYESTRQALLPAFFEGMWAAKAPGISIIDGNELSYWYRSPGEWLKETRQLLVQSEQLMAPNVAGGKGAPMGLAQAVFYDGMFATHPTFEKGFSVAENANWHAQNVRFALATSDKYLWYYTERMNCWENAVWQNTAMKQLQAIYAEIQQPVINAAGHYFGAKPPMQKGNQVFTTAFDAATGQLQLQLQQRYQATIQVYHNHQKIFTGSTNRQRSISLPVSNTLPGSIIVELLLPSGGTAYAIAKW